jgi:hypothetical protein
MPTVPVNSGVTGFKYFDPGSEIACGGIGSKRYQSLVRRKLPHFHD